MSSPYNKLSLICGKNLTRNGEGEDIIGLMKLIQRQNEQKGPKVMQKMMYALFIFRE